MKTLLQILKLVPFPIVTAIIILIWKDVLFGAMIAAALWWLTIPAIILSIVLAFIFTFLNGMNDAANSISTIIATKVMTPIQAIIWASFWEFTAFIIIRLVLNQQFAVGNTMANFADQNVITPYLILSTYRRH